jgi:hypothetical protein
MNLMTAAEGEKASFSTEIEQHVLYRLLRASASAACYVSAQAPVLRRRRHANGQLGVGEPIMLRPRPSLLVEQSCRMHRSKPNTTAT